MFRTLKISMSRSYVGKVLPGFLGEWMSLALKALQNRETMGFGVEIFPPKNDSWALLVNQASLLTLNRNFENHLVIGNNFIYQ